MWCSQMGLRKLHRQKDRFPHSPSNDYSSMKSDYSQSYRGIGFEMLLKITTSPRFLGKEGAWYFA